MRGAGQRGLSALELLLISTVIMVAIVVAAYVKLPDVQRGVHALIRDVGARLDS